MSSEDKVEYFNRECAGGCGTVMEDLSWRQYCNDCFDERSDHAGREPEDTEAADAVLREALGEDNDAE